MCFYPHFPNFSADIFETQNRRSALIACWSVLGFAKTDVVKTVLKFGIENVQKFTGDSE
jgi:hypothetical protein